MKSQLMENPKSKVIEKGYINIYSELNSKEKRQIYYKTRFKKEHPEWDESMVLLSNEFKKHMKSDLRVLDAGCGNGNYIIDENRRNITWAVGVDVLPQFVEKNICLDEIKIANLERLPFDNNKFDMVTSLWVLEHLKEPEKVFIEFCRVLKPGGVFLFATPNKYYLPLRIMSLMRISRINHFINKILFGREKTDIFKTYYKANSLEDLKQLSKNKFNVELLKINYDPSYTSFNEASYKLSIFLKNILEKAGDTSLYSHIIGVFKKP